MLATQGLDVGRYGDGFDAIQIVGVANAKSAGLSALTHQRACALDDVLLDRKSVV